MQSKPNEDNNKDKNKKKHIRAERRYITSIKSETEDITIDFADIRMIKDYSEHLYTHENDNLEVRDHFLKKH